MDQATQATVLIINDDPTQLRLASATLARDGLHTVACRSAEEALHFLNAGETVDVIVTDLYMPTLDGWRFCRLLRSPEYSTCNDIPVLVMSATFAGADAEQMTVDLGANAFLPSPYDPKALRECVRDLLAGRAPQAVTRLLIVEDSLIQTTILEHVFKANRYTVYTATTGAEGQRLFRECQPDVVILDYHLPDMQADQLLTEFVQAGSAAVAIVITANPTPELALRCMRLGADGYVRKPFSPEYLLDLCARARRERALLRVEDLLEERTHRLRESEARFRALFDGIPDTVLVHDIEGYILHLNTVGAQWLHWPAPDIIGRHLRQILAPHHVEPFMSHVQRALVTGASRLQTAYVTRTSQMLEAEVHKCRIEFEGRTALLDVIRDTTERSRLEAQMRQMQKLQAIGTLAGGIAHEFNNMLTVILGYTELSMYELPPAHNLRQNLQQVLDTAQRARGLVQQMTDFSRQSRATRQPVQLTPLVHHVLEIFQAALPSAITLHVDLSPTAGVILANPTQIEQVVLHLCTNAMQAMQPEGGQLAVYLDTVEVDKDITVSHHTLIADSYLRLQISDTGLGMAPEIVERVFEPFFTTREVGEGTGMGLAVVDGIIASHNGAIAVTSTPGQGSTFTVYLPSLRD